MFGSTRNKRRNIFILCMVFIIMLSGCSAGSTTAPKKEEGTKDTPVTLEWWSSASLGLSQEDEFKQILAEYKKVAPHVTINYNAVPTTGLDEKMNVAIASGSFPDLYVDAVNRLVPLYNRGVTTELDSYITDDYKVSDYVKSAKDIMVINGKLAMFLMEVRSEVLLVNKDLFVKAGVENLLPDPKTRTWTRDNFAKAVEAIGKLGNGVYGMGMVASDLANDKFLDGYIYSDGDEYTNKDFTKVTYNTPGNVKKLEWLVQLATSPYAVPGASGTKVTDMYELFKKGKVAVIMNDRGDYRREINEGTITNKINYMNAHFPTDDGSQSKLAATGSGIVVKKQSDKVKEKEAAKFAMWFSSGKPEIVNKLLYQKYSKLPSRKSLEGFIADEQGKVWLDMPVKTIVNPVGMPNYMQIRKAWFNYFQQAMLNNGKMTAKDALAGYEKEVQKLLDEGNKELKK
ncbi:MULTISPECIES: ABC transporter substrate-binding protein [unclassified Paenibacillus]|uniref:ABC transporter substrate-binding protein n=1 Tax=unclassified Paenibacillus TaxID=185978 RepID=UPI00362E6AB0